MPRHTTKEIKQDKLQRLKKVKRQLAAVENRDISDVALIDQILDKGLGELEEQLGIQATQVESV